ncbi:MAG: transglycosylase domain-containing protein [Patescibacteria group bacterium]
MKKKTQKHSKRKPSKSSKIIAMSLLGSSQSQKTAQQIKKQWKKLPTFSIPKALIKSLSKMLKFFGMLLLLPFKNPIARYGLLIVIALSLFGISRMLQDLPSPRNLTSRDNFAVSTQIFDRNGQLLYEIYADENRIPIKLADLPPHVGQAAIAIEDQHFYSHHGFDIRGIIRASYRNLQGQRLEGGSTITQQLVKNALLSSERSWQRKIKEAVLSVFTELLYTKEEILEMYLNYISYGGTAVGIESAAQLYFDKHAKDLTVAEAALLAGLPQAPTRYSPFGSDPTRSKNRQEDVLRRMHEDAYITSLQYETSVSDPLTFALSRQDIEAPHFVFFVRDLLYEEYGTETVERGGLRVTTTLDLDLQKAAQASVAAEVASLQNMSVTNGASLVVAPNTGEILAMVGSKDYFATESDGQVNVTLASRQPGSSIKPLMYATAFQEKVLNPGTMLLDVPTCFTSQGQQPYCPRNYDGTFRGPVTVRNSLGSSLNIPAVKGLRALGLPNFINQASAMGITSWQDPSRYGLSLTLGGGEVRMIDMAQAFGVLANQGVQVPLSPFLKVEDYRGEVLFELNPEERLADLEYLAEYDDQQQGDLVRVMDSAPAYMTSHIMQDNQARIAAFGPNSSLVIPNQVVSAKTGTTNDLRDNWTIGFTPEFLVITWVGNNDNSPMNRRLVSGVTGAAPIFNDIMSFILQDRPSIWQEKPTDVLSENVCPHGMPPQEGESCRLSGPELYWTASQPSASRETRTNIWIDPTTGLPPPYGEQVEGLVLEERTIMQDPVTDMYCVDCNRPVDEEGRVQRERHTVSEEYSSEDQNDWGEWGNWDESWETNE